MCQVGRQDGIDTIVATPHILPGIYKNHRSNILSAVSNLNDALSDNNLITKLLNNSSRRGDPISRFLKDAASQRAPSSSGLDSELRTPNSELRILPGADVHFSSDLLERLEKKEILTVNDQGRFLMVEFAFQGIPFQAEDVLFKLLANGITPVISHPERNMEIGQRPQRYYQMVRTGCLGQVTAMSLTGEFGPEIKKIAERLLAKRLIHFIATDAHSLNRRPPILSAGVRAAEKIVGKKEAQKMVTEYPEAIIDGRQPDVPEPLSP